MVSSLDEIAGRRREVEPMSTAKAPPIEEEERDGGEIEQRDALVIAGQKPRRDAVAIVQIMLSGEFCFHYGSRVPAASRAT